MSRLLLIRHAQASFMAKDYDQLSELGKKQSALLADHLLIQEKLFNKVYIGPLRRHFQTANFSKDLFLKEGANWDHALIQAFDEHHGPKVVDYIIPQLMDSGEVPPTLYEETNSKRRQQLYFDAFQKIMRKWTREEWELNGLNIESWISFRKRVRKGLRHLITNHPKGHNIVVFTSGGAIAAAVGEVLHLTDDKILDLSWMVLNASITELVFSKDRITLKSFNGTPHLLEKSMITFV